MSFKEFLKTPFVRNERLGQVGIRNRRFAKGIIDFLQNLLVVSIFFALAGKSGSWLLSGLAFLGLFALGLPYFTYFEEWGFPNVGIFKRRWVANLVSALIVFGLLFPLVIGVEFALQMTIRERARVQSQ